jgi:molybdate transport system substrate-binding protein
MADNQEKTLTIIADPSLTVPLNKIARAYALEHDISITTVFSSTKEQMKDIEAGAEGNVIITAKPSWLEEIQQKGLIDVFSKRDIARNHLVLAGSQFTFLSPDLRASPSIMDFTSTPEEFSIAIGDATTTAEGGYAIEALGFYRLHNILEPYYTFLASPQQIIRLIERYGAMGIMFRTDVLLFPQIKEIAAFDDESHRPILYQAAAIIGDDMDISRHFIHYLTEEYARECLREHGFSPLF